MSSIRTETETVVKRVLPYLRRRGYNAESDIDFETAIKQQPDRYAEGYVDLLVTMGRSTPQFVVEAKRNGKRLTEGDARQALDYGTSLGIAFVVVTNGAEVRVYNVTTREPLRFDGKLAEKIPSADQLPGVLKQLRKDPAASDVKVGSDSTLPFRPGLPLKQLNALFARCHNKIRNIEKNEEHAFADFSKLMFLRLLEEKAEAGTFDLPYSYRFHELAARPASEADRVKNAILTMLEQISSSGYGDVLVDPLRLKKPQTFHDLVKELASVSFEDSGLDTKGAAFEYFVRATLKGKRLGQYFTPRPLVDLMVGLVGRESILSGLRAGATVRVLDPACGTGGFLVFMLKACVEQLDQLLETKKITKAAHQTVWQKLCSDVFFGIDANDSVAAAAKMNLIVAGDGHANIHARDALRSDAPELSFTEPSFDLVLTNPPFGTSEADLPASDLDRYPVSTTRGQLLFLQRMVLTTRPGGFICTVIDEGVLNTDTSKETRRWLLQNAYLRAVVRLPEETFKPNKINVRSSVLLFERRDSPDVDPDDNYWVTFCDLQSLGYHGSGEPIRKFDFDRLRSEFEQKVLAGGTGEREGYQWRAFDVKVSEIVAEPTCRIDLKYWDPVSLAQIPELGSSTRTIEDLNLIPTDRGVSPKSELYVDEEDGFAIVVKAGSTITSLGELDLTEADYIEKLVYEESNNRSHLQSGDVVLASTGTGTLGKASVARLDVPAVADGHVTIIRCDPAVVFPEYLADYLRCGKGRVQVERLYSGSTGLIELTKDHVKRIRVELPDLEGQRRLSDELRAAEKRWSESELRIASQVEAARQAFTDAS